ncbi:MAG: PAS domain S-box protein [Nitrospirales bacterium]
MPAGGRASGQPRKPARATRPPSPPPRARRPRQASPPAGFGSPERFQGIFHSSKDAMAFATLDGLLVEVNDAFVRLAGYSREALLQGVRYQDLTPQEYLRIEADHIAEVLRTGDPVEYETVHRRHDATQVPVLVTVLRVIDSDRRPIGLALVVKDMTEDKRAQARLRASEERFRLAIDHANDAILFVGPTGVIEWANHQVEVLTGRMMNQLVGRPLADALSALPELQRALLSLAPGTSIPAIMELDFLGHHDTPVWLEIRGTMVQQGDEAGGRLFVIRDITGRKQVEHQLRQMEKLDSLAMLLSGVAHEIHNPLFILSGHIQLAQEKLKQREYESANQDLTVMQEAARRTSDLVRRFLRVAGLGEGRREQCDLNELARRTLDIVKPDLESNQIELRTGFMPDLPPVWTNPQELGQVLLNLITNARQAMWRSQGHGVLTINSRSLNRQDRLWVEIRISDDGPGIPPEHLSRIFDPFFTTKPTGQGTGLGLAISHRIVTGLRGTLSCESQVGKGTTFVVQLPVQPRGPEPPPPLDPDRAVSA